MSRSARPTPLTASASSASCRLGLQGEGGLVRAGRHERNNALQAALTVRLLEPAGSTDGRVSLAEMLGALDEPRLAVRLLAHRSGQLDLSLTPARSLRCPAWALTSAPARASRSPPT